jgi:hypothetical protein
VHHHSQLHFIRNLSAFTGASGILWLLAIGEGHSLLFSSEFGTVLASALTSAGLAVSAAMWIMNLVIDRKLSQFEKDYVAPNYMTVKQCGAIHEMQDERYNWIKDQLEELKNGQVVIHSQILKLIEQGVVAETPVTVPKKRKAR